MKQPTTCHALGVCQSTGCPDCEAFECEVACSPEPARPTFPFAPGVIEGPEPAPMTRRALLVDLLLLLASSAAIGTLAGYLMERFA